MVLGLKQTWILLFRDIVPLQAMEIQLKGGQKHPLLRSYYYYCWWPCDVGMQFVQNNHGLAAFVWGKAYGSSTKPV